AEEPPTARAEDRLVAPPHVPAVAADADEVKDTSFRTPNFVVTAPTRRIAQLIGQAAEQHRRVLALRWLGKELPPWPELCPIKVKITLGGNGSATSFAFDQVAGEGNRKRGAVIGRQMHQEG